MLLSSIFQIDTCRCYWTFVQLNTPVVCMATARFLNSYLGVHGVGLAITTLLHLLHLLSIRLSSLQRFNSFNILVFFGLQGKHS